MREKGAPQERLSERLGRILDAAALNTPDRVPVVLEYGGFAANVTGAPLPKFYTDPLYSLEKCIDAWRLVSETAEADAIHYPYSTAYGLAMLWMSKVRVPGVDLPEDVPYQIAETELMHVEDYDEILSAEWSPFYSNFMRERVFDDVPERFHPWNVGPVDVLKPWHDMGVPVLSAGDLSPPFECLCGARSLSCFIHDLFTIPDKVEAVMDHIVSTLGPPPAGEEEPEAPFYWVGGWRGASSMLSPGLWNRFVWPYFVQMVDQVVDAGYIALLHLDSDWTRDLERFRELPRGRCVMALDGATDIYKAREILDGHMCVMGDVSAGMFKLSTPDEVYEYSCRLVRDLGPDGFILQSGCDIPFDARLENVQAMVEAAVGG
jgi:hypothetical protein